jgi:hypothetical protein
VVKPGHTDTFEPRPRRAAALASAHAPPEAEPSAGRPRPVTPLTPCRATCRALRRRPRARPRPPVRPPVRSLCECAYRGLSPYRGVKPGPYFGAEAGGSPSYKNDRGRPLPVRTPSTSCWHPPPLHLVQWSIPQSLAPLTLASLLC